VAGAVADSGEVAGRGVARASIGMGEAGAIAGWCVAGASLGCGVSGVSLVLVWLERIRAAV